MSSETITRNGESIGTITTRSGGFEARKPGIPTDSRSGWVRYDTRKEAIEALERSR